MNIIEREHKYDCIIKDTLANHNIDGKDMVFHVKPTDKGKDAWLELWDSRIRIN